MAETFTTELGQLLELKNDLVPTQQAYDAKYSALILAESDSTLEAAEAKRLGQVIRDLIASGGAGGTGSPGGTGGAGGGSLPAPSVGADPLMPYAVFRADGSFDEAAYNRVAASLGDIAGVDYKHGPRPSYYGTDTNVGVPLLVKQVDHSGDEFSSALNPNDRFARGCRLGYCGSWQLGGPVHANEAGMYSSNMGQFGFVPDFRNKDVEGQVGVLTAITFECGANTMTTKPELPWHYRGDGYTSINVKKYGNRGQDTSYITSIGRAGGWPGRNHNSLITTRGGLVMGDGQNTSSNELTYQLPGGLVPIDSIQTNASELALHLCWDTVNKKGVVVCVALAGTPEGCYPGDEDSGKWWPYRGEWRRTFPGLPNFGNLTFGKVLGAVDTGLKCPTSIAASTFHYLGFYEQTHDNPIDNNGFGWDLRKELHRAQFRPNGPRSGGLPKRLLIAVASKEEKKVVYIDGNAMLKYFRDTYLSSNGVGVVGVGAGQFPATFAENPSQRPVVIRTDTYADRPTSLRMSRGDTNPRVYIGFQPGYVDIVNPGPFPSDDGSWNGSQIAKVGSAPCGRNPTCIALVERKAGAAGRESGPGTDYFGTRIYPGADVDREIIVVSRGDRRLDWIRMNASYTSGAVERTLMDQRLKDPVWAQDNPNHTTEHYEVTVADFEGRQLYSGRYGPGIFWDNNGIMADDPVNPIYYKWDVGLPPNGFPIKSTFVGNREFKVECGGLLPVPGYPFCGGMTDVF
jgi:hypothetical protein